MNDQAKTKQELIEELSVLKQRLQELEYSESDRKQAEEELKKIEEKYRSIMENIEDGYYEVDLTGNFTFFNDSMYRILGYPKEEMTGMNNRQYTDKENAKKLFQAFNEVYKTGEPAKGFDWQIIRKDGTKRFVEASISLQKDSSGNPIGFRGIAHDITEHKQMEEEIHQSAERYRTILEEMEDGYFEVDLAGNFLFINDAGCRLLGCSREELLGTSFRGHLNKEDLKIVYNAFGKIYSTGKPERGISYRAIRKDGTTGFAEIAGFPLQNQKGEIIGFRGIGRDITARRKMEEALRESEQQHRVITDNIQDAVWLMDMNLHTTWINPTLTKIAGFTLDELAQIPLERQFTPDSMQRVQNILRDNLTAENLADKNKEINVSSEFEFYRKNGDTFWCEMDVSLLRDAEGKPTGFLGVGRDITKRLQTEKTLYETQELLRDAYHLAGIGSFNWNSIDRTITWSEELCRLAGLNSQQLDFHETKHPPVYTRESWELLKKTVNDSLKTGKSYQVELEMVHSDGSTHWLNWINNIKYDKTGKITRIYGTAQDITDRKRAEDALRESEKRYHELSIVDELTQLYNSRHFYFQLKIELDRSNRYELPLTLLLLDIDNFKAFNDAYGHVEGDQVLWRLGQVVKRCLRETDFAYRYGGEEFTIILPMTTSADGAVTAERIRTEFKKETFCPAPGQDVHVTVSIGLAQYTPQEDMKAFVHRVDQLMYKVKKNGKDKVCSES